MTIEEKIQDALEKTGAILENGHFELKSGMHTDSYINVLLAITCPKYVSLFGDAIAQRFKDDHIDAVVGFTFGGTLLAQKVADALEARTVLIEKEGTAISFFSESQSIEKDENVLIVDEGITTGNSIRSVLGFVEDKTKGIKVVGVVVDRSEKEPDFGVKTEYLIKKKMSLWPQNKCPLCEQRKPLTIIDSPEENPFQIRFSLPKELYRSLHPTICKVLEEWGEDDLLGEIKSYESPAYELPGEKHKRVAILGSFHNFAEIEKIAKEVAALKFYGISSALIYHQESAEREDWTHYEHETMNDFLRRMIYSCQYAIVGYTIAGGQLIETTWCSQSNKPTLGLVQVAPWAFKSENVCEYLLRHERRNIVLCNGFCAYKSSEKIVGSWVCERVHGGENNKRCPFLYTSLSKMILDFFTTSSTMYLVGYDPRENLGGVIRNFLDNKGILNLEEVP